MTLGARRAPVWPLLLIAVLAVLVRLPSRDESWQRDVTTYAVIGHEMRAGRLLYTDLWDHKPPGIHAAYRVAEAAFGYGSRSIFLLGLLVSIATLFGVHRAASACDERAGTWAAAYWALLSVCPTLQAEEPNAEVFVALVLVWGLALLLELEGPGGRRLIAAGVLLGSSVLFKPNAAPAAALIALAHLLTRVRGSRLREAAVLAVSMALPAAAVLGYFAARGRLADLTDAVVVYNRFYAGAALPNLASGLAPSRLMPPFLWFALPIVTVCVLALGARPRLPSRPLLFLGALALGIWICVSLPGRFFPHYYALWLPLLALAGGWAITRVGGPPAGWALAGVLAFVLLPDQLRGGDWGARKWWGAISVQTRQEARLLDAALGPGESFYEWGAETGLFFFTKRSPPSGVFYDYPLLDGPLADRLSARVIADLERARPALIVVHDGEPFPAGHPLVRWFIAHYDPIESSQGGLPFRWLKRKPG